MKSNAWLYLLAGLAIGVIVALVAVIFVIPALRQNAPIPPPVAASSQAAAPADAPARATPARGGEITFVIQTSVSVTGQDVEANINLKNIGTEPAKDAQVIGTMSGTTQTVKASDRIGVKQSADAKLNFTLPQNAAGTYPLYLLTTYKDANGAAFSAASVAMGRTSNEVPVSQAKLKVVPGTGDNLGHFQLAVSNLEKGVANLTITCFVPKDLRAQTEAAKVEVKDARAETEFVIENVSGRAGSRYGVFFVVEYDSENNHYTAETSDELPILKSAKPAPK